MRIAHVKFLPVWITAGVVVLLGLTRLVLAHVPALDFIEGLELLSYDARARVALRWEPRIATNLAVIEITDDCIAQLNRKEVGGVRWPWPRYVFAKGIQECKDQGAVAVAMDLFFFDRDHGLPLPELGGVTEDDFLAGQIGRAGNVLLATTATELQGDRLELAPIPGLFRTNACGVGQDGVPRWGAANRDVFRQVPAFVVDRRSGERVWHLGLMLAARAAGADLAAARVEPGRITVPVPGRGDVVIPVDARWRFYTDWSVLPAGPQSATSVEQESFFWLYLSSRMREQGTPGLENLLAGRAVVMGSTASGLGAYDHGATPVSDSTPLLFSIVNAANSLLTGRFVHRAGPAQEFWLSAAAAVLAAGVGWRLRGGWGLAALVLAGLLYLAAAVWLYVSHRYWLPVVLPLGGTLLMTYVCLLSFRLIAEREQRAAFGRLVSPNIFHRLVHEPASVRANTRQAVTVYFADLRGFTRFVEANHARTQARLREQRLTGAAAEQVIETDARDGLATVNLYVGCIADVVKAHDGTLDKYIGDCVMSFWGAPLADERHAVNCVRAAIAVHRAVRELNSTRGAVNHQRAEQNRQRQAAGETPLEPLPILTLGSAINSGVATVGFMGSAAHMSNYTVFGREVNIASRLEHVVGGDRIFITWATFRELERHAPELAEHCLSLGPMLLEGVPEPIEIFEVNWLESPGRA
jgi:adenylate cyclase